MADLPISLLPTAEGLDPADLLPVVQNGVTKKIAVRTIGGTPLALGPTVAASSVPVTIATDQFPIPVKQVNQEVTQVSLSLLGIPRSEVALGIFGDVNTYDVNPLEWTSFPAVTGTQADTFGVRHLSAESAAQISCPPGWTDRQNNNLNFSRLTSKRFFRYQPGRVSSGTFGIRHDTYSGTANGGLLDSWIVSDANGDPTGFIGALYNKDTTVKKWGCFDNQNGYYFEIRGTGEKDGLLVVRRTTSLQPIPITTDLVTNSIPVNGDPAGFAGYVGYNGIYHGVVVRDKLVMSHAAYYDTTLRATSADIAAGNYVTVTNYPNENTPAPDSMLNFYGYHWKNFSWITFLGDLTRDFPANNPLKVKTEYANVYEYRVPRSLFNYDQGNGQTNLVRWSDAIGDNVPGDVVLTDGAATYNTSVKNLDFTKVTMYKVEYSWYGAVGAQFLAYVPVTNQLARWVRLHHMRVSNQLAVPSLGNPTLPFTYLNIAGASKVKSGLYVQRSYKYGASYLIDGGDKGTVKINSVATDIDKIITPDKAVITVNALSANDITGLTTNMLSANSGVFNSYYVGTRVYGQGVLPNVSISDVSIDGTYAFIANNQPLGTSSNALTLTAVSTRGTPIVGIQVKDTINSIRNRSQVYPLRMSVGASSRTVIQLVKNPIFPSLSGANKQINNYGFWNYAAPLTAIFHVPETVVEIPFTSQSQFIPWVTTNIGKTVVGSFYGIKGAVKLISYTPTLGSYTFKRFQQGSPADVAPAGLTPIDTSGIRGNFIPEIPLRGDGVTLYTPNTASWTSVNYLAAVNSDSYETRTPVPGTGEVLATFNVSQGGTDIDLAPYFGYDKQYLSYPLVESGAPDTLYLVAKTPDNAIGSGGGSLTWEEQ